MASVIDRVIVLFVEMFVADDITADTTLGADLEFDSLDRVELLTAVEEEFGFDIDDDVDAEKWTTVRDVADYVSARLGAA